MKLHFYRVRRVLRLGVVAAGRGSQHVVTAAGGSSRCDGQQAELLLRAAHPEGVPLRGLAMAGIPPEGRPPPQVTTAEQRSSATYDSLLELC